jgi:hypothetical protein
MPMPNVFTSNIFSLIDLTAALYNLPYVPTRLSALGLFEESGITTTTVVVEQKAGELSLVPAIPRGAPPMPITRDMRTARAFQVPHLPERATLLADSVQNVRAFGNATELDSITAMRDELLLKMKRNLDATIEFGRMGAIQGTILDATGSTLYNLFTEFGVGQQSLAMEIEAGDTTTNVRAMANQFIKMIRDALGGVFFNGVRVFCGQTFWEDLISHPSVEKFYLGYAEGAQQMQKDPRQQFFYAGCWWEYYYGYNGATPFIADTDAYAVPTGCPGLLITSFAPADYMETVNTMGQPYYAKSEVMDMDKGLDFEVQSNPLSICTRPRSIIKLTTT